MRTLNGGSVSGATASDSMVMESAVGNPSGISVMRGWDVAKAGGRFTRLSLSVSLDEGGFAGK